MTTMTDEKISRIICELDKNPIPGTGTDAANCSRFSAAAGSIPDAAGAVDIVVVVIGGGAATAAADEATEEDDVTAAAAEVPAVLFAAVVTATGGGWAALAALFRSGGLSI